ncbi:MAG: hypothetical protein WCB94_12545 [Terriglobales bacterium]
MRDLVKSRIMVVAGEKLCDVLPGPVVHRGHAIECRIDAGHPEKFTWSGRKRLRNHHSNTTICAPNFR